MFQDDGKCWLRDKNLFMHIPPTTYLHPFLQPVVLQEEIQSIKG